MCGWGVGGGGGEELPRGVSDKNKSRISHPCMSHKANSETQLDAIHGIIDNLHGLALAISSRLGKVSFV